MDAILRHKPFNGLSSFSFSPTPIPFITPFFPLFLSLSLWSTPEIYKLSQPGLPGKVAESLFTVNVK
jgi:hypothetical protein